jgi:hypothetical protein
LDGWNSQPAGALGKHAREQARESEDDLDLERGAERVKCACTSEVIDLTLSSPAPEDAMTMEMVGSQ